VVRDGRALIGGSILVALVASGAAAPPPSCPPGRFVVTGLPLVSPGRANGQALVLTPTDISISGVCGATPVTIAPKKRGTLVKARWGACGGYGRSVLKAMIDPASCEAMTGTLRFAYGKGRLVKRPRHFSATRRPAPTTCTGGLDTFAVIEQRVFGIHGCSVTTCHGKFASGELNLLADVAYDQLVDVPAANAAAAADGKKRVVPGDPAASFLVQKLRGGLPAEEGSAMPLVGTPLDADEIALVEAWIAAGAPRTGRVESAPCLPPPSFVPVTQPPVPAGGYQLELDGPTLQPGEEQEGCLWIPVPYPQDFLVGEWEFVLNPGTHHFAVFQWDKPGVPATGQWRPGDVGCTSGAMFGATLSGAPQAPYFVDSLPPGLARVLPAGGYLGLNAHYANAFDVPIPMKVWVNVHPYAGTPAHVVQTLTDFDDMFSIDVPPGTQKVQPGRLVNAGPQAMAIVQLQGHMHKRGLRFTARRADGSTLFDNYDWAHPVWWPFDPPLVLGPGEHIDYECLEDNGVTREGRLDPSGAPVDLKFGLTTDDEMCTLTAIYYDE
jgi:hypothetical protein